MAITRQDVWRVADEIDREGGKPGAVEVRKRLGAGSYTTITAALKDWPKPEERAAIDDLGPIPGEVIERMTQAAADVYALVMRKAVEDFEPREAEWKAERERLAADRQSALEYADLATDEADDCRKRIAALERESALVVEERAKAQGAATVLQAELDRERKRADMASAELAQARVQITAQQVALDAAQRELEGKRATVAGRKPARGSKPAQAPAAAGVQ